MSKHVLKLQSAGENSPPSTPLWRKILFICVWLFWLALLGLMVILAYSWTQRYDIIEEQARRLLAENNIAGDLDIIHIGQDKLRIESVTLRDTGDKSGEPFFTADIIEARYAWRELIDGQIKALSFTRPKAMIEIDSEGKIVGGWIPPTQSDNDSEMMLPEGGIDIKEGHLTLLTPYGQLVSAVDANIKGKEQFDARLNIEPSALSHEGQSGTISGMAMVVGSDQTYLAKSDIMIADILASGVSASAGQLTTDIEIKKQETGWQVNGPFALTAQTLATDSLSAGTN